MGTERKSSQNLNILREVSELVNGEDFTWALPSWGRLPPPEEMRSKGSSRFRNTFVTLGLVVAFGTALLFGDHRQLSPNIQPKPQPFVARISYHVHEEIPPSMRPAGCRISYENYNSYLMSCG